jgi:hypothetical protein
MKCSSITFQSNSLISTTLSEIKLNSYWVTGFADAESSFIINISKNKEYNLGWQVKAIFQIELHNRDLPLLLKIQQFFQVGKIQTRSNRNSSIYTVTALKESELKLFYSSFY